MMSGAAIAIVSIGMAALVTTKEETVLFWLAVTIMTTEIVVAML